MDFGSFMIALGFLLLGGAGLIYAWSRPEVQQALEQLRQTRHVRVMVTTEPIVDMPAIQPAEEELEMMIQLQVSGLKPGQQVQFAPTEGAQKKPCTVVGLATYECQNHLGEGRFASKDENWPVALLLTKDGTEVLLMQRPDGVWAWISYATLIGDEAKTFNRHGEIFSQEHGQEPGSYKFTWRGREISILDVGYFKVANIQGDFPHRSGNMVKFLLGEIPAEQAMFLMENNKQSSDYAREGYLLGFDLNDYMEE